MTKPIYFNAPPDTNETHLCCDFIELVCLVSPDGELSKADIADRWGEMIDVDRSALAPIDDESDDFTDATVSELNDKWERRLSDWFVNFRYRTNAFRDFYPFEIREDEGVIILKDELSERHKLYIFFLLASNLRYVRSLTSSLTRCFEVVSQHAFSKCLPPQAEVYVFGTSAGPSSRYAGNKWQKVLALQRDLRANLLLSENHFDKRDSGDGGLDIVAWIPTGDSSRSLICIFGQCACTEDWITKQFSSSADAWAPILAFHPRPFNVVFVPFCYRDAEGDWFNHQKISQNILMDRVRMLHLLTEDYEILKTHPAYNKVEMIIEYTEDIV